MIATRTIKKGTVSVKPYFDPTISNMGLEKYGLSLWDGVYHEEQLAEIGEGVHKRYVTGLDENAHEIKGLPDDLREAKILEIRKTIAKLEKEDALNTIPASVINDLNDEDPKPFWTRVKKYRPDNHELWSQVSIKCGNEDITLDPEDPKDLIKIKAIEAGGFALIARSYEDARSKAVPPKFYLDKYQETASTVTELKKLRNKALSELQTLFDTNTTKLFYIAKIVDGNSASYKKSTPNDVIYDNMDKFINGEGIEKSKKRAASEFLETTRGDMETLKLRALVKDATFYKFIALKPDGFIYHMKTGSMLGRSAADVVEFLKNPLHDQVLKSLMNETEKLWNS